MSTNLAHSISFVADGLKLSGSLHLPNRKALAAIVGCHGLMADKNSPKQIALARRCAAVGLAYFRFDHRGCGASDGIFKTDTSLENRISDLKAAVQAVFQALGKRVPIGLFGSSFGGTVCLSAACSISPFAIVTLAAPIEGQSIKIPVNSPESLKAEIVNPRLTFDLTTLLESIHHILIVHGSRDETVSVENAHRIYSLARDPKRLLILENGDHRISQEFHQERFMVKAVQWFSDCYHDQFNRSDPPDKD